MSKKNPTSAIALDLDGTLTNSQKQVTERTRQALLQAEDNGAVLILASGRPTYGIVEVMPCAMHELRARNVM